MNKLETLTMAECGKVAGGTNASSSGTTNAPAKATVYAPVNRGQPGIPASAPVPQTGGGGREGRLAIRP